MHKFNRNFIEIKVKYRSKRIDKINANIEMTIDKHTYLEICKNSIFVLKT